MCQKAPPFPHPPLPSSITTATRRRDGRLGVLIKPNDSSNFPPGRGAQAEEDATWNFPPIIGKRAIDFSQTLQKCLRNVSLVFLVTDERERELKISRSRISALPLFGTNLSVKPNNIPGRRNKKSVQAKSFRLDRKYVALSEPRRSFATSIPV